MTKNLINTFRVSKIFLTLIFVLLVSCDQSKVNVKKDEEVTVKVFSSLTCPHCADFHEKVTIELKKEYVDTNRVKFEHRAFPLDLAALNAEKILNCFTETEKRFSFLNQIYKKQKKWALGSDINVINDSIKKIGREFGLNDKNMNQCLADKEIEDKILDERIDAQKKYKISSTPTIYINEKKYEGKHEYKSFKKELDKSLTSSNDAYSY